MSTLIEDCRAEPTGDVSVPALRIEARQVSRVLRNGTPTLTDVTLTIEPGQLVAIIGASGSGKTTLLETLSGLRQATRGGVFFDGYDVHQNRESFRGVVGYVPQDDIIHRELPIRATIRHAAQLRLPHLSAVAVDDVVECTIATLGLSERASTVVGRLSGGQRKRVSIAVELLTRPRAFFLDEPTSGLDPGTARNLLTTLRRLAGDGSTIVLTTHSPDDVIQCDEVIVVGRGGRVVFHGPPARALEEFGVADIADIYGSLEDQPETAVMPLRSGGPEAGPEPAWTGELPTASTHASIGRQWAVLRRRNVEVLLRNRLTLAIMLGAPVLVVTMFVILFRPGAFDPVGTDPLAAVGVTYWLAFAAFFFGLTYGLLQVCTEIAVVKRERHVGLDMGAYLLAKVTVLVPVLLVVNIGMVTALQATGRLPATTWTTTATLVGVLLLDAVAALTLGLLASAAVSDPSHATLALPMLCFPAVLFGGAVLPVRAMATAGHAISAVTSDRWAFEAIARVLGLNTRFAPHDGGSVVSQQYGTAFVGTIASPVALLILFSVACLVAGVAVLRRRTATN